MAGALSVSVDSMRYPDSNSTIGLIKGLSFDVPAGGFVSLLGRTGVGKTTLLRIIAGLEQRFAGCVTLDGERVVRPGRAVQLVFQDMRLLPWKTVRANVEFATKDRDDPLEQSRVTRWLSAVGLEHREQAWPKTLSGGEQARVAFARALVDQPRLLLLDEPFRGLDIATRFALQDELNAAIKAIGTTVVMVSHSIEDAVFLSDIVHLLTDSPMRIERSFTIEAGWPRQRGSNDLAEVEAAIVRHVSRHPAVVA